jgi:hypothetical protein
VADPSNQHAEAIHGLLVDNSDFTWHFAEVVPADSDLTFPYGVVWPAPGGRPPVTLAGNSSLVSTVTRITGVGRDPNEVLAVLDRAAEILHRVIPVIPGRRCSAITQDPTGGPPVDVERDPQVRTADGRPVFYAPLRFALMSTRLS